MAINLSRLKDTCNAGLADPPCCNHFCNQSSCTHIFVIRFGAVAPVVASLMVFTSPPKWHQCLHCSANLAPGGSAHPLGSAACISQCGKAKPLMALAAPARDFSSRRPHCLPAKCKSGLHDWLRSLIKAACTRREKLEHLKALLHLCDKAVLRLTHAAGCIAQQKQSWLEHKPSCIGCGGPGGWCW